MQDFNPASTNSLSSIAKFKNTHDNCQAHQKYRDKYKDSTIEAMVNAYKNDDSVTGREKSWIITEIYLRLFYLIPYIVKYHNYVMPSGMFEDFVQNSSISIINAINRFDPTKGTTLVNYMAGDLLSGISKTFRDANIIYIPPKCKCWFQEEQINIDTSEFADVDVNCRPLDKLMHLTTDVVQPERTNYDIRADKLVSTSNFDYSGHKTFVDVDFDEELVKEQNSEMLKKALDSGVLTEEERQIVIFHNGLFGNAPLLNKELATMRKNNGKGASRSRISQIHSQAIVKLKKWFKEQS